MNAPETIPGCPPPVALKEYRAEAGRPTIFHEGRPVVAADALALLSGVNFASVEKVLAGLRALQAFSGVEADTLVALEDVPLRRVHLEKAEDALRASNTRALCEAIATDPAYYWADGTLRLTERFC